MANLAEAMNTFNPALLLIKEKGYKVELEVDSDEEVIGWRAISKNSKSVISAHNPASLLGLVMVWEKWGDKWKTVPIPDLYMQIYERTFSED